MKYKIFLVAAAFSALTFTGCAAHKGMRGTVAMKVNEQEAHVCLGKNEVSVGDKLNVFRTDCKSQNRCLKVKVGEAKVTQVLDDHYSVAQFDPGVTFEEGTVVEKP